MEADLLALIITDPALTLQVGDRINWNIFPQGVGSPAIRLVLVSGTPGYVMHGGDGLIESRVQADVRALSPKKNDTAGYKVGLFAKRRLASLLSGYRGAIGATWFNAIYLLDERQYAERMDGELFHVFSLDFRIFSRGI